MKTDFPAAHSMDTTWFAIDRDGHVAVFESGEAGAVPTEVAQSGGGYDEAEALLQLPDQGALVDLLGLRSMLTPEHDHATIDERTYEVTAFVRDPAAIEDLVRRMEARVYPATTGSALVIRKPDPVGFAELHNRGACVMCVRTFCSSRHATHGVYDYSHSDRFENWIAGPYARIAVPVKPITADELPTVVLDVAIRFAGRFADLVVLQPAEHWPSRAHSNMWVATDHKTHRDFETGEIVIYDEEDD